MQSLNDIELDLVWFFQRGEAECGNSSSQGHLLYQAKLGAFIHGHARDLFESERMTGNVRRYRTVNNRVRSLSPEHQAILAASYNSPESICGVALALAAATPRAVQLHAKQDGSVLTVREWVLWLCVKAGRDRAANAKLTSILKQSRQFKQEAVVAYQEATIRKAA